MITRPRSLPAALGLVVTLGAVTLTVGAGPAAAERGPSAQGGRQLQVAGFLGEQRLPGAMQFQGTTVGWFSGLDRDRRTGTWFFVSDDRSALQPARFYTADLNFDGPDGALSGVELTGRAPFRRPDGSTYPAMKGGDGTTVDSEDICVHPLSGRLLRSQEGDRIVPADGTSDADQPDRPVRRARWPLRLAATRARRAAARRGGAGHPPEPRPRRSDVRRPRRARRHRPRRAAAPGRPARRAHNGRAVADRGAEAHGRGPRAVRLPAGADVRRPGARQVARPAPGSARSSRSATTTRPASS